MSISQSSRDASDAVALPRRARRRSDRFGFIAEGYPLPYQGQKDNRHYGIDEETIFGAGPATLPKGRRR